MLASTVGAEAAAMPRTTMRPSGSETDAKGPPGPASVNVPSPALTSDKFCPKTPPKAKSEAMSIVRVAAVALVLTTASQAAWWTSLSAAVASPESVGL